MGALVLIAVGAVWYGLSKQQETPMVLSEPEALFPIKPIGQPIPPPPNPPENITPVKPIDSVQLEPSPPMPSTTLPTPKPVTPTLGEAIPPTQPSPPPDAAPANGSHTLEIEATQLTWVVVQSDQQTPKEALLQPGQRITWKANKQFQLTLGNAAGVVIRLNGQSQGPFGKPGQVVRDIRLRP